jgi:SAM-dependent methyltransferase
MSGSPKNDRSNSWFLFVTSAATLYAELMLIRWIGTEIRIFAFFQNLTVIACFLGFGLGCYRSEDRIDLAGSIRALTVLAVMVSLPFRFWRNLLTGISDLLAMSPDATLWGSGVDLFGSDRIQGFALSCAVVGLFIILLTIVMVPFGQLVARYMNASTNILQAYSINLVGSIIGIWLMAGLSFVQMPPIIWFAVFSFFCLLCHPFEKKFSFTTVTFAALAISFLYIGNRTGHQTLWSPYQKLTIIEHPDHNYTVEVNNSAYMTVGNVSSDYLDAHPQVAKDIQFSSYDSPFRFAAKKDRVLVVGAGAGNDVAAALRSGALHVDAVEIDPTIQSIGARLHPEHSYQSPKVKVIINDARNFLRSQSQKYDVIVFGLLDSHTGFSSYSNMRIDNYVYTTEAFRSARDLLAPGGILILKFEVREPWTWMGQRFYVMLSQLFGRSPLSYYCPSVGPLLPATVFIESNSPELWARAEDPSLKSLVADHPVSFPTSTIGAPTTTTDDWPYVYHRNRTIPAAYLTVTAILLLISFMSIRHVFDPSQSSTWEFFFLGAGFLLLETQLINRLALFFGSTWIVNCIAITLLLAVLVVANLFVERGWGEKTLRSYAVLVLSLLVVYAVPFGDLPFSSSVIGLLLCVGYSIPVFCAGLIFTRAFQACESKPTALGANVFGAVAGGIIQNVSFVVGLKAMLLAAAAVYVLAALVARTTSDYSLVPTAPAYKG